MKNETELSPEATVLIAQATSKLARALSERDALTDLHRQERARVMADVRAAKLELAQVKSDLRVRKTPKRPLSVQAGPAAMEAVRRVLRRARGRLAQREIVSRSGLNEGTVSYAIRALIEAGEVELTGRQVDGSRELRLIPKNERVVKLERNLYEEARKITGGARTRVR